MTRCTEPLAGKRHKWQKGASINQHKKKRDCSLPPPHVTSCCGRPLLAGTVGALHIEGNTFPVEQFYLEDLVEARLRTAVAASRREQAQRKQQDDDENLQGLSEVDEATFVEAAIAAVASAKFSYGSSLSSRSTPPGPNQLPEDYELASIAAAAANMSVVPYDASIGVDNYKPHMDYTLKGRARAAVLDYQVSFMHCNCAQNVSLDILQQDSVQ